MTCYDYVMLAAAVMIAVETGKDDIKDRTMLCMKRLSTTFWKKLDTRSSEKRVGHTLTSFWASHGASRTHEDGSQESIKKGIWKEQINI